MTTLETHLSYFLWDDDAPVLSRLKAEGQLGSYSQALVLTASRVFDLLERSDLNNRDALESRFGHDFVRLCAYTYYEVSRTLALYGISLVILGHSPDVVAHALALPDNWRVLADQVLWGHR